MAIECIRTECSPETSVPLNKKKQISTMGRRFLDLVGSCFYMCNLEDMSFPKSKQAVIC